MLARLRHYRFDWKLSLLTALLLPLLLSLGFWQLEREQEKRQLQQLYEARQQLQPVMLGTVDTTEDQQYLQVEVQGSFDNTRMFLLDNRIYQGRAGYEVVVPLQSEDGTVVFINRGWLPPGATRAQLPEVPAVEGTVTIRGAVYVPVGKAFVLGSDLVAEGWPRVIQTLDPQALHAQAGYSTNTPLFPYTLRVDEGAPGALVRYWPVITTTPEKHRGYAVQWFAMATMLLGLYLWYSTRDN
jgi:surfeit locus 1 family protein